MIGPGTGVRVYLACGVTPPDTAPGGARGQAVGTATKRSLSSTMIFRAGFAFKMARRMSMNRLYKRLKRGGLPLSRFKGVKRGVQRCKLVINISLLHGVPLSGIGHWRVEDIHPTNRHQHRVSVMSSLVGRPCVAWERAVYGI